MPLTLVLTAGLAAEKNNQQAKKPTSAVNRFIARGDFKIRRKGASTMIKPVWMAPSGRMIYWPQSDKQEQSFYLSSTDSATDVTLKKGKGKASVRRYYPIIYSPMSFCSLPMLNKMLIAHGGTYLLDPETGKWERTHSPGMSPRENNYDPCFRRNRQLSQPIWGNMVYDPVNGEAVMFGGAGVWGRHSKEKVKVQPGDWIYEKDAVTEYRLVQPEENIDKAERWFPGHCGTWMFSEETKKWSACPQPLVEQPRSRILPSMCYVPDTKEILLFGGDTLARCLDDTWVYSCDKKTWSKVETPTAPPHRAAAALVYVPEAKQALLIGGYRGHWRNLRDVWAWDPEKRTWSALNIKLPGGKIAWVSAAYASAHKRIVLTVVEGKRRAYSTSMYEMSYDPASVKQISPKPANPWAAYHGPTGRIRMGKDVPPNKVDFAKLPANTWVNPQPKQSAASRGWGQNVYDPRTRQVIVWGGGHSTYPGIEYDFYDVVNNRFLSQNHPIAFNPKWWHQSSNCPPGVSLNGTNYVPGHSRRGYGVDPVSGFVVTCGGDVIDPRTRRFVKKLRESPFENSGWGNPANVAVPGALYFIGRVNNNKGPSKLAAVDVNNARWRMVSEKKAPFGHHEYDHMVYDTKRNRIIHVGAEARKIHAYDLKSKAWSRVKENGARPAIPYRGGSAYIPEIDAICTVIAPDKKRQDSMYFFKLDEGRWYTTPYQGARYRRGNDHGLTRNIFYDPELKLLLYSCNYPGIRAFVMRPDFETLRLTPLTKTSP